jgi:hypothetical protein
MHIKKVSGFPSPSRYTYQTLPGREKLNFPGQGEFGKCIPAGEGKTANLFLQCVAENVKNSYVY